MKIDKKGYETKMDKDKKESKVVCKYKDAGTYAMVCEEADKNAEPEAATEQSVAAEQPAETPATVEQPTEEEIAVPVVGDTEAESVEPLGETASWYPSETGYNSVVNYEYGTSSNYIASLTNPEVGFEVSDILLVILVALSCLVITGSVVFLSGRALRDRIK